MVSTPRASAPVAAAVSPVDKGLAIAAAIIGVIAIGSVVFIMLIPT